MAVILLKFKIKLTDYIFIVFLDHKIPYITHTYVWHSSRRKFSCITLNAYRRKPTVEYHQISFEIHRIWNGYCVRDFWATMKFQFVRILSARYEFCLESSREHTKSVNRKWLVLLNMSHNFCVIWICVLSSSELIVLRLPFYKYGNIFD